MGDLAWFKRLAQAFVLEADTLAQAGRTNEAALVALECVVLGSKCGHGGPILDQLVGVAVRAIGLQALGRLDANLDAPTLARVAVGLESALTNREPEARVLANEDTWVRLNYSLSQRLPARLAGQSGPAQVRAACARIEPSWAQLSRATLDCAARACESTTGQKPATAADLVPRFLQAIPRDPVTEQPLALPHGGERWGAVAALEIPPQNEQTLPAETGRVCIRNSPRRPAGPRAPRQLACRPVTPLVPLAMALADSLGRSARTAAPARHISESRMAASSLPSCAW